MLATDNQQAQSPALIPETGLLNSGARLLPLLASVLTLRYDPSGESSDDHRDRLFLQVLVSLSANIVALIAVFYFLLPLSEAGREKGGPLLWVVLGITVGITLIFLRFGLRTLCVNLLLMMLSGVLLGASFILGGLMSPTMIFLLAVPVLASTLMHSRWAYFWTAITVAGWLLIADLEYMGVQMTRITHPSNVGIVQVMALLGTILVVMAVLGSYVSATNRLRKEMQLTNQRLDYLASHDSLTSIPNRRTFFEQAQRCLQRSIRSKRSFALLVIDLNDFKQINDRLGHKVGDAVLLHFAQRMSEGFRDTDFIGRLGGDEFGVLLEPVENAAGVSEVIERFRACGPSKLDVDGNSVLYDFAVGVAIYPEQGQTILDLYDAADGHMYHSKKAGLVD